MSAKVATVSSKNRITQEPGNDIPCDSVVIKGRWIRVAEIFDEVWQERSPMQNPADFIAAVASSPTRADVFTFAQSLPETEPHYSYPLRWDSLAVADTRSFDAWWKSLPQESRKNVRRCHKHGVIVVPIDFTDDFVRGIKSIYDETPLRQGRRFLHYGKDFDTVKRENSSYLERSQFIGAFLEGQLIGFIKIVFIGRTGRIMQILSRNDQYSKHPANALLAAAVEACAKRGAEGLIYGQYVYGNKRNSSVIEFKRRNGFNEILLPRYFIPLSWRGRLAVTSGLVQGWSHVLPEPVINFLLDTRSFVYQRLRASRRSGAVANGS